MAYSLRKLSSTYTGNCIKVREDQTNQEQEFGFVNDVLDIDGIEAFLVANGNANGFVVKLYEQSNAFNVGPYPLATTGTPPNDLSGGTMGWFGATQQLQIAANGVVYVHNGHPYMRDTNKPFILGITPPQAGNGWMQGWGYGAGLSYSSFNVEFYEPAIEGSSFGYNNYGGFGGTLQGGGQTTACMQYHPANSLYNSDSVAHLSLGYGGSGNGSFCMGTLTVDLNNKIHLATDIRVPASGTSYFNLDGTTDCSTTATPAFGNGGFRIWNGQFGLQPYFMEYIYYQVEKTPAEIDAIEAEIMTYYTIP